MLIGFIPLFYLLYQVAIWQQIEEEKVIKIYCPQGLNDKKNPCGLTSDSLLEPIMIIIIVVYTIITFQHILEWSGERQESKNGRTS